MKYILFQALYRSLAGSFCIGILMSTTAFLTSASALFLSAPFVDDATEAEIALITYKCGDAAARYTTYMILLTILGGRIYYKNADRAELETEILKFDRAEVQL